MTIIYHDFKKLEPEVDFSPPVYIDVEDVCKYIKHVLLHTIDSEQNKFDKIAHAVRELEYSAYQQGFMDANYQ